MNEYRHFHRVVLAYVNQMFQQISGIYLITYYIPQRSAERSRVDGIQREAHRSV
jgi:hypothetical protein